MRPAGTSRREPICRGSEAPGNTGFAKANVHEARRDLKERANLPGERSARQHGFRKANVHEARRDLKERAPAGGAKHPATRVSPRRTSMRPAGTSRREPPPGERSTRQYPSRGKAMRRSRREQPQNGHHHAHKPSPISATVPPTTTYPGCPEGGAPMGSPLARGI